MLASGVIKRYPNGSDFKMELTFRLNRNGVASLDSAEVPQHTSHSDA